MIDVTVNEERVVLSGEVPTGEVPSGEVPTGEVPTGVVPSDEVVALEEAKMPTGEETTSQENSHKSVKRIGIPVLPVEAMAQEGTETVAVTTGEMEKRVKLSEVHQEIEHLRKLSQDFVEMERKKSVEFLNQDIPVSSTNDGFAFSDDNSDDFDVPDVPI